MDIKMKVVFDLEKGGKAVAYVFILIIGIPLLKEEIENQNYREACRRRGDKTYWYTDGLRYTKKSSHSDRGFFGGWNHYDS